MKIKVGLKPEALRYMGVKGVPDEQTAALVDTAEKLVYETISPKYVFRAAKLIRTEFGLFIDGMNTTLPGNDIRRHLDGCTHAVVLAATLTSEADKLIRQAAVSGAAEALAMDAVCSAAIEQICDCAEEEIFQNINSEFRTWRFSPGYGDFPIHLQSEILNYLNASRRIGLTVTDNSLLIPSKSVTAIIGISENPINKGARGCAVCSMRDRCAFSGKNGCRRD